MNTFAHNLAPLFQCCVFQWCQFSDPSLTELGHPADPFFMATCKLSCFSSTLCDATDCSPQTPQSMGFSRQDYQSGLPFPPPGDLTEPQDQTRDSCISCITGTSLPTEPPGMPVKSLKCAHCTQVSFFFFLSENDTSTIIYIAPIKMGKSTAWLVWLQCLHTSIYLAHRNQD